MRKAAAWLAALLMLTMVLPPGWAAEEQEGAEVVFEAGLPDENGLFDMTVTVRNADFWGLQFCLGYDRSTVIPADGAGQPAEDFSSFVRLEAGWMLSLQKLLDRDRALVTAGVITTLGGDAGGRLNSRGELEIGPEGLRVFTLRFKRLKEGDAGFRVAQEGARTTRLNATDDLPFTLIFRELQPAPAQAPPDTPEPPPDRPGEGEPPPDPPQPPPDTPLEDFTVQERVEQLGPGAEPARTAEELLEQAVILPIGSHAAVTKGGVRAIYPGERSVTAYAHDNRTFVPVRFVAEQLGAEVSWDNATYTVTVEQNGHTISMAVGALTYSVDGEARALDVPAEFLPSEDGNSRTMVPIRFVAEALDYQVEWDQAHNFVIIAPRALGWDPAGAAEGEALSSASMLLMMFSSFV